jgi:hypothetical protein
MDEIVDFILVKDQNTLMKKEGLAIPPDTFPPLIDNPLKHIY